jgi:SAM-dependent methyltransferase
MHIAFDRFPPFLRFERLIPVNPGEAYPLWAPTYPAAAHNPLMRAEQSVVEPLVRRMRATRALDVGTGSGRYLPVLASTGAAVVLGVDRSLAMLAIAAGRRICGDACHLPFRRGAFDLVNASLMVGDIGDLGGWTREMARVLAVGGHLVYSDFHPTWAQHGWTRTFHTQDGERHVVSFEAHPIEHHVAALEGARLRIQAIREPRLNDDEDRAVRSFRRRWGNPPVVVVFHATKEP